MDPELIAHATKITELVLGSATARKILGKATDEVAEMLATEIRTYRYGRSLKLLEKATRMAEEAGFTPKAVPIKLLSPLLEGASLEEDESLHDMWAALLANAASPEPVHAVRPGFIAALKQMAPDEAALLSWIFQQRTGTTAPAFNTPIEFAELLTAHSSLCSTGKTDPFAFHACVQSLQAQQLIEQVPDPKHQGFLTHSYALTMRGVSFMFACRPPKTKV
jgi:hypothetical protein